MVKVVIICRNDSNGNSNVSNYSNVDGHKCLSQADREGRLLPPVVQGTSLCKEHREIKDLVAKLKRYGLVHIFRHIKVVFDQQS